MRLMIKQRDQPLHVSKHTCSNDSTAYKSQSKICLLTLHRWMFKRFFVTGRLWLFVQKLKRATDTARWYSNVNSAAMSMDITGAPTLEILFVSVSVATTHSKLHPASQVRLQSASDQHPHVNPQHYDNYPIRLQHASTTPVS